MKFTIFASLLFYLTLSAAWPWPANLFIRDSSGELQVRQNNNNNNGNNNQSPSSASPASTAAPNTASATGTRGTQSASRTASGSVKATATSKPTGSSNNNGNQTVSTSIDPRSPPGGLSLLQPAATSTTYYKYGDTITWVWNYTSLIVTPSAVDVLVSNTDTGYTFTVAANVSVAATQTVTWDTGKESNADITDQYTLAVYDAGNPAGVTALAQPGMLGVFNQFRFAMYTPQPYVAIGDGYRCVTCNGAVTAMTRQAMGVMVSMAGITVLSFTYFASGFMSL